MIPFPELVQRHAARGPEPMESNGPMAWIKVQHHDGTKARLGPYPRWMAELLMGAIAFDPGHIRTSVLEPEPRWVTDLAE